ncbi:MAG: glycosyltransferase family 39 protein [Prevotella sp.]|nr:glycosyltransferase family 39 protein [Prevotella sp.]
MQNRYRELTAERFNRCCWALTICFLLLLLGVLIVFGYTPTNDGEGYIEYAQIAIADHQPYPTLHHIIGKPYIWNMGIINLVALSLGLTKSLYPLLILFCIMKALTAWLLAHTTAKLFNRQTALIALILYILYPNNWGQSTMLSSEIPMLFFTMLALYTAPLSSPEGASIPMKAIVSPSGDERGAISGAVGGALALANWFRPVAAIFLLALVAYFFLFRKHQWKKLTLYLLSGYAFVVLLIGTSCYLRTGYFLYQADSLWFNMAEATYETDSQPHYNTEVFPEGTARYIDDMQHKTAIECSHIWRERSLNWLSEHPVEYLKKVPARLYYIYQNDIDNLAAFLPTKADAAKNYITLPLGSLRTQFSQLSAVQYFALLTTILYLLLLLLAIAGALRLMLNGRWREAFLPVFIIVAASLALALLIHGETRFKAPFMPFLFMLAASFLSKPTNIGNRQM